MYLIDTKRTPQALELFIHLCTHSITSVHSSTIITTSSSLSLGNILSPQKGFPTMKFLLAGISRIRMMTVTQSLLYIKKAITSPDIVELQTNCCPCANIPERRPLHTHSAWQILQHTWFDASRHEGHYATVRHGRCKEVACIHHLKSNICLNVIEPADQSRIV